MVSRTVVVGLDGLPRSLALRLADEGVMPTLRGLIAQATLAELVAPVPDISSTSWASFLTGLNPGGHRIFGFVDLKPGTYEAFLPTARHLAGRPLWEWVGRHRMRSMCLNVPGTYPAVPVPTGMVSGFVAPDFDRAVQPPRWRPVLRELGYQLEVDANDAAVGPAEFLDRIEVALERRTTAFVRLLSTEPFDLAVAVITETDRMQHFRWCDVGDEGSPWWGRVRDIYRRVDESLARMLAVLAPHDEVFLVSDHGFTHVRHQVYLNSWLREAGYLAALDATPSLSAIGTDTAVFALDPGRLYLNRRDRFPAGKLTEADAELVRLELTDTLQRLRFDGGRLAVDADGPLAVAAVLRNEDIYHGPYAEHGPDLVAMAAHGFQLRGGWTASEVVAADGLTGTHTRGNALFLRRGHELPLDRVDMTDVLPTVLASVGIDTGSTCDGRAVAAVSIVDGPAADA